MRSSPEIRCNIAEEVFLHVISNVDAGREDKLKLLMEIERHCPEIVRSIDEQKILEAFYDFVNNQKSVNLPKDIISSKLLSHEEIDWANRYCEKNNFQNEKIRYLVFRSMLIAGERMDKMRRHYKWGISKTMLKNWACDVAIGTGVFRFPLDIFKKVNIILEFDLENVENINDKMYIRHIKRLLLYYGFIDLAKEMKPRPKDIISTVKKHLSEGDIEKAKKLALIFYPNPKAVMIGVRQEIKELEEKIKKLNNCSPEGDLLAYCKFARSLNQK
ncbi:hypothetical protein K8R32_03725 [bacterium]|nr:hypothetical protein [bacterium]